MQGRSVSTRDGQASLRKGLVVVQFACSAALLFSMLVIGQQMDYIRSKNLGYERENVLFFALSEATYKNRKALEEALKTSPGVLSVTTASDNLLQLSSNTGDTDWEGKTTGPSMIISPLAVAPDFLDFFKMNLVAGRGFTGTKADSTSFIVNEAAVAQMGMTDPVGKRFKLWQTEGSIVGVVKNFHFASLRETIKPAVFISNPEWAGAVYVKTTGAGASQAVAAAQGLWQRFDPKYPFDYKFLDDSFDKMYRREQRTTSLFKAFSAIALLVSCLGLFGLSAFTVQKRQKEISIRKVLGASVLSITNLLTADFLKLVGVAIALASPAAYFLMRAWLSDFAYRIDIQWWMFLLAGAMAVAVALLTVSFQSVKAALSDPVKALKSE
jgi:putative ABC transport system permease protein